MSVIFPKWFNALPTVGAAAGLGGLCAVVAGFWYWATPSFFRVGYMPRQPGGGFNHQIHAGKLGLDCRYCHTKVEQSAEANVPNVATCNGCHADMHLAPGLVPDAKIQFIRDAYARDESIAWRRVHKLPDYVRNFPHNVHVKAGVSCFSCHGQMTAYPEVFQQQALSMSWCLSCHRDVPKNPEKHLVPKDKVTSLQWVEEEWMAKPAEHAAAARELLSSLKTNPPENCGACHY